MTLARLFSAALVICSLPALSQDQKSQIVRPSTRACMGSSVIGRPVVGSGALHDRSFFFDLNWATATSADEPWKIVPNQPDDSNAVKDRLNSQQIDKYKVFRLKTSPRTLLLGPEVDDDMILSGLDGEGDGVTTCLKIRSYVVARDSKDSDSTHPVSYSTCQPSSRYHVKTTEIRTQSVDR
jgi:hypothetical protein